MRGATRRVERVTDSTAPAPTVAVILLAAGEGLRLGRGEPKAFVHLAGRPILAHALESLAGMRAHPQIVLAVPPSHEAIARELLRGVPGLDAEHATIVVGGASRQASVRIALAHLAPSIATVLVHDAARPLTPAVIFDSVAAEVERTGEGVITGLAVSDTIKRLGPDDRVAETLDRSQLTAVQTPQGFPRAWLEEGHARATEDHTDDAALVSDLGMPVRVIAGDQLASKITTTWELRRTEEMLQRDPASTIRVGTGTDVHAFHPDAELWLGGLLWPGEAGLAGHSDGDVVAHAICDAMLSAVRLGDVGEVFGTSDPRLEGARGDVFLAETLQLVHEHGYELVNVSVQVVGERPRISSRRREVEAHLSAVLGASVSVAGTTSDALGFTGRGEGVAAIATALVRAATSQPAGPHGA
ncbi:2-C-methyl-D-erythritol 2,4-cyclodiphosphate synthase [Agrococcus jejuensis]|uniref:Bifunctional enzyme IspD/IspF n=1 Tax=Agrococcus jejuensis TaxID=399736 RepID=A0A1G8BAR5_9MICO|nr:2-C-methyl-D-erythritol 2,4-cyclodiphosphate synthase [Agrococcus jejuensis]